MKDLVVIILKKLNSNELRMNHERIERLVYGTDSPLKIKMSILSGLKETGDVSQYDWKGLEDYLHSGDYYSDIELAIRRYANRVSGGVKVNSLTEAKRIARRMKPCRAMQTYIKYYDDGFKCDYPNGLLIDLILES